MRYYTRAQVTEHFDEDEEERLAVAYLARLDAIEPHLSETARVLARTVYLHDAFIESARWNPALSELTLKLVADQIAPVECYETLTLVYSGARLDELTVATLERLARDRDTEILRDEVDRDDATGHLEHRILFWPDGEIAIEFRELSLTREPREDRRCYLGGAFQIERPDEPEDAS